MDLRSSKNRCWYTLTTCDSSHMAQLYNVMCWYFILLMVTNYAVSEMFPSIQMYILIVCSVGCIIGLLILRRFAQISKYREHRQKVVAYLKDHTRLQFGEVYVVPEHAADLAELELPEDVILVVHSKRDGFVWKYLDDNHQCWVAINRKGDDDV